MKTNAYIDGFNFYYGCYRHNPANRQSKWIDFRALCSAILPNDQIHWIHYFTAMVSRTPWDPDAPLRQETFVRALRTGPMLRVHLGRFQPMHRTGMPVNVAPNTPATPVKISTWEEKGSDVNLATRLLTDAVAGDYEQALVISNDSDLTAPIRAVRQQFNIPVIVVSPYPTVTKDLRRASSSHAVLDHSLLATCQMPSSITDKHGRIITKPASW